MSTKKSKSAVTAQTKDTAQTKKGISTEQRAALWKTVTVFWDTYKVHNKLTAGGTVVLKEVKSFLERKVFTDVKQHPSDEELTVLVRKLRDITPHDMLPRESAKKASQAKAEESVSFPDTYKVDRTTLLERVKTDDFDTIKSIIEDGSKPVVALMYWNKKQIQEFQYGAGSNVPPPKDGFPDDFDAVQFIYANDYYAISQSKYTEHAQIVFSTDFKLVDGKRMLEDLPFELYTAVEIKEELNTTKKRPRK
jgi:hypothetical protein